MLLDIGSLMFNMDMADHGGTPSWGTAMGQGADGHKFSFDDMESFLAGMLYNSVSDITKVTNVWCPLGKGGARQNDYEYVMASIFKKVYANNTLIPDARFLLVIVKQIVGDFHIDRRTLKYNPRMTYEGVQIDQDAYDKIPVALGYSTKAAWFVRSISIKNQDELHLEVYFVSDNPVEYPNVEARKDAVNKAVAGLTLGDYGSATLDERKKQFRTWLMKKGLAPNIVSTYPNYLDNIVLQKTGVNVYTLSNVEDIEKVYNAIKDDPSNVQSHNRYSSAVTDYKGFVEEITKGLNSTQANYNNGLSHHAANLIIYGTPGCGKSYYVDNVLLGQLSLVPDTRGNVFRTTFYPDYSNVDFVGQIIPKTDGTNVTYEMMPGPFTLALEKAYQNLEANNDPVVLVIEELNRGNAAAIFGDIFQLLDRDEKGNSRYHIKNQYIQAYLDKAFEDDGKTFSDIYIPNNLYLIATMNTSDQNVFKLDNAFKRRWSFQKMKNFFDSSHPYKNYFVPGMDGRKITWETLVKTINDYMLDLGAEGEITAEDKQIGVYFLDKDSLINPAVASSLTADDKAKKEQEFESKTLEYLWDDVAKYDPTQWFRKDIRSLDDLMEKYPHDGEKVFADDFREKLEENLEAVAKASEAATSSVETTEEGEDNGESGNEGGEEE